MYKRAIPPTTGGSTSGNRTNALSNRWPGKGLRARTNASGMPRMMHTAVLAADVRRLSPSAVTEDSDVISGINCGQLTLATIATIGSRTKSAPAAAMT
ncbi:hypothetical protein StoSoilB13_23810 [Arthrobacter sp. StoSoilB13]|nr:hypothetical protein StoSoilB13_23810 [Arthrobacter sp. StoSoilB13]